MVRTFIIYTIYRLGDKYFCRGRYEGTKIVVADAQQDKSRREIVRLQVSTKIQQKKC